MTNCETYKSLFNLYNINQNWPKNKWNESIITHYIDGKKLNFKTAQKSQQSRRMTMSNDASLDTTELVRKNLLHPFLTSV